MGKKHPYLTDNEVEWIEAAFQDVTEILGGQWSGPYQQPIIVKLGEDAGFTYDDLDMLSANFSTRLIDVGWDSGFAGGEMTPPEPAQMTVTIRFYQEDP